MEASQKVEAAQKVEATQQVGFFVKTKLDLLDFVTESQGCYFRKRGIDSDHDAVKAHLDLVKLLLSDKDYCYYYHNGDLAFKSVCFFNFFDIYEKSKEKGNKSVFNTDMLGLPFPVFSDDWNGFGIVANSFLFVLSHIGDNYVVNEMFPAIKTRFGVQDFLYAVVEKMHYVYNERKGVNFMRESGFDFYNLKVVKMFGHEPIVLAVMIRCGVREKTTSLYCKKLTDSVSCFGEEHKDLLSFRLVEVFLLEYYRFENDNKEVFWRYFKILLQETGFNVNLSIGCFHAVLQKEVLNHFIFNFLYRFQEKLQSHNIPSHYKHVDTKDNTLICILTELTTEHRLDIGVLDYDSKGLCEVLSDEFDKERIRGFMDFVRTTSPRIDSPDPNNVLCLCEHHKYKRRRTLQIKSGQSCAFI